MLEYLLHAALSKNWKQPKCPKIGNWLNKSQGSV